MSDETTDCAGCGGEVSVVEAIWLPLVRKGIGMLVSDAAKPYCCVECHIAHTVPTLSQQEKS